MKNYAEILEQMKKNGAEIKAIENKYENIRASKLKTDELNADAERLQNLKIENAILRDNARRAYAADVLPAVFDILKKYDCKAYGERTKDKMRDELKTAKNCAFYISHDYYRDELHVIPLNENGYSGTMWNYDDFDFSTGWSDAAPRLLNDNKINGKIPPDALHFQNCGEYVENVPERVKRIKTAYAAALAAESAAKEAERAYNALLPSQRLRRFELGKTNYSTPI